METLNLDDAAAFLRGIEMADDATVEAFVASLRRMREQVKYSNEDFDRRMQAMGTINVLRKIGNTPLK